MDKLVAAQHPRHHLWPSLEDSDPFSWHQGHFVCLAKGDSQLREDAEARRSTNEDEEPS